MKLVFWWHHKRENSKGLSFLLLATALIGLIGAYWGLLVKIVDKMKRVDLN